VALGYQAEQRGEGMTGNNSSELLNMTQRTILQHLNLTDWKMAARLPIPPSELTLSRLVHQNWIEMRGENQQTEVRLTEAGLKARGK
jgi:hypothetical protein